MHLLIFPHQLFQPHPGLELKPSRCVLIEDSLFFGDSHYSAKFHKQKLWLHRASMKRYQHWLESEGYRTEYLDYDSKPGSLKRQLASIAKSIKGKPAKLCVSEPVDFMLEKRLDRDAEELGLEVKYLPTPGFLNETADNQDYRQQRKRWFMADFYKWQRKRLEILVDGDGNPVGDKWSFDDENRKKVPRKMLDQIPAISQPKRDSFDQDAVEYVEQHFADHPGSLEHLYFATSHHAAENWLDHFLKKRFDLFGDYEDAIVEGESWLWHSVLTPALNIGLLTPQQIVDATLKHAEQSDVPLNSLEGFLRQIIGWREFIRATYEDLGVQMRNANHWNHRHALPDCFYDGSTGIDPIDDTISRILKTGYCHHIERLMVLGGFMFLCEIQPRDIYRWFMELFVDSYDWVMVPNVYAMSQHADGGLITTKPYFSGSSYIRKMSHWKKGPWCDIWDGLYWRWIWNHIDDLSENPRWAMMCATARRMDQEKRQKHLDCANQFLDNLWDKT